MAQQTELQAVQEITGVHWEQLPKYGGQRAQSEKRYIWICSLPIQRNLSGRSRLKVVWATVIIPSPEGYSNPNHALNHMATAFKNLRRFVLPSGSTCSGADCFCYLFKKVTVWVFVSKTRNYSICSIFLTLWNLFMDTKLLKSWCSTLQSIPEPICFTSDSSKSKHNLYAAFSSISACHSGFSN